VVGVFSVSTHGSGHGAFARQLMCRARGVSIPAHITELSPDSIGALSAGFASHAGWLIASSVAYTHSRLCSLTHLVTPSRGDVCLTVVLRCSGDIAWLSRESSRAGRCSESSRASDPVPRLATASRLFQAGLDLFRFVGEAIEASRSRALRASVLASSSSPA